MMNTVWPLKIKTDAVIENKNKKKIIKSVTMSWNMSLCSFIAATNNFCCVENFVTFQLTLDFNMFTSRHELG